MTATLDNLFSRFVSIDVRREPMTKMHGENGFVYVTNGHIGFEIPADMLSEEYPPVDNYPDLKGKIGSSEDGVLYSIDRLRTGLAAWDIVPVYQTHSCRECDGDGMIECFECGHLNDCKKCEGTGEIPTSTVLHNTLDADPFGDHVKFEGATFRPDYIFNLVEVIEALDADGILVTNPPTMPESDREVTPMQFRIGPVRGALMPMRVNSYEGKSTTVTP